MNNNTLAVVIGVLVLIGIVFWIMSANNPAATPSTTDVQVTGEQVPQEQGTATSSTTSSGGTSVGVSGSATVGEVKSFTVTGKNFTFAPATMSVSKGDRVRIVFKNAEGTHDLKIDEFGVNTGILQAGQEKTVEFVANTAGTFEYYCSVGQHRQNGMKGTLTVK